MPERIPTVIGRVKHVLGAEVTVGLDSDLAGVTPLWEGRVQRIGQIGSLVVIPQGPVRLIAAVTMVGIAELGQAQVSRAVTGAIADRWLEVQLLGEVDGLGRFRRGVSSYPSLDDPVHFVTSDQLAAIFPPPDGDHVRLGRVAAAPLVPFAMEAEPLVVRHSAVIGSTGSGKSSAVATLVRNFATGGWGAANIVIVDPHGEYSAALSDVATVRSVLGDGDALLRVPFWALPANDILSVLGGTDSQSIQTRFGELVRAARQDFVAAAEWIEMEPTAISADTPVPFDLRAVWWQLEYDNRATYEQTGGAGDPSLVSKGNPAALVPPEFEPHSNVNQRPFRGPLLGAYGGVPDRIRLRLQDPRLQFFQKPEGLPTGPDPLVAVVDDWLGNDRPVSVLDFSGVPTDVTDLAIGVVMQLLLELALRSKTDGIGRPRPVLVVLEEAHRYLGETSSVRIAREAANRIAREGRKYGIGLMLVSQRPSELPPTALSQVGTIVALRLTNGTDQSTVRSALPDSVGGLASALAALRTGEAVISGEAVTLPGRVLIDPPSPPPDAADPNLASWRDSPASNELSAPIARWRGSDVEAAR